MSDKTVAQKLGMKEDYKVLLLNEPAGYRLVLGELPRGVTVLTDVTEPAAPDFIQVFVNSKKELEQRLNQLKPFLKPKLLLWVTYPKGTSKVKTDINRDSIREFARPFGLEGVAMISVDETWSALRLKVL